MDPKTLGEFWGRVKPVMEGKTHLEKRMGGKIDPLPGLYEISVELDVKRRSNGKFILTE